MKHLLILSAIFFASVSFAKVRSVRIDPSSTNIPAAFSGSNGLVGITGLAQINSIMVDNQNTSEVVVNCSTISGSVPSDSAATNIYVAGGEAWVTPDQSGFSSACYIRGYSGAISSGSPIVITAIGY